MEIEKKFLLERLPIGIEQYESIEIKQCYISTSPVIRIRQAGNRYLLTVKGKGTIAKEEFEMEIDHAEYCNLYGKIDSGMRIKEICKTRYLVPLTSDTERKLVAEVDEYHGALSGLLTVEVEFEDIGQAEAFVPPDWFGEDVTEKPDYSNSSLSVRGLPSNTN